MTVGLLHVGTVEALVQEADVILSICAGFDGIYVDANAISPARAKEIAALRAAAEVYRR